MSVVPMLGLRARARRFVDAVRNNANDLTTPEGRARERQRRAVLASGASALSKVISVSTALITIPLTLHYLGSERFGMWMVISSLSAMLSFADLGIGNGVINSIAAAHGKDDVAEMRRVVSSGALSLGAIAAVILLAFAAAYRFVPWGDIFNIHTQRAQIEAGPTIAMFVACFAAAIPTNIVHRVEMGLQLGFLSSLWLCAGSFISLVAVLVAVAVQAGLPWLVLAFLGGPIAASLINALVFFTRVRPDLRPTLSTATRATAAEISKTGALFFLLQVAAAVCYNSDNFIIAQLLGASAVAQFSVPDRLFSFIAMGVTMALTPLWPAYRESILRGDTDWTRRTLIRSLKIAVGAAAVGVVVLIPLAPAIIHFWVGDAIRPSLLLIVGLGLWKVVEAAGMCFAMFLNGAHVVRPQVVFTTVTAVASIVLEIILVRAIGVAGAVWGTLVAYVLFSLLPFALLLPRILSGISQQRQSDPEF